MANEECKHFEEYDEHGRYVVKCVLTGNPCTTVISENGSGGIDVGDYRNRAAIYCPAFNLEKTLAKKLQKIHLDKQMSELTDKLQ